MNQKVITAPWGDKLGVPISDAGAQSITEYSVYQNAYPKKILVFKLT